MHTAHAEGKQHDIVLVPKPSNDPDDPLNWSPRRKMLSTSCMCMYVYYLRPEREEHSDS